MSIIQRVFKRTQKLTGRHQGDVRRDEPILIEADAEVAGDVVAPQVLLRGLVCGRVVAHELHVEAGGRILGDVWVETLEISSGGAIQGWVSPLRPEFVQVIDAGLPIPAGSRDDEQVELEHHAASLAGLRAELAEAVLARTRIEEDLEERVAQAVRASRAEAQSLLVEQGKEQAERRRLQDELALVREHEHTLAQALHDAQKRERALTQTQADLEAALSEMTGRRDRAVAERLEFRRKNVDLERQLEESQQRINRLIDDLARANRLAGDRFRQIERLSGELDDTNGSERSQVDDLQKELETLKTALGERDALLDDLGSNLVESQNHVEQQHWELLATQQEMEGLNKRVLTLQTELEVAYSARQQVEGELQRQEAEILRYRAELDVTQAELDQTRDELRQAKANTAVLIDQLATAQARLAEEAGATRELEVLQDQLGQTRRLVEAQKSLAETRTAALPGLQDEVDRLKRQQRLLEANLSGSKDQVAALKEELVAAHQLQADLRAEVGGAEQRVKDARDELTKKTEQFRRIIEAARGRLSEQQVELDRAHEEYASVQKQAAAWRAEAERAKAQLPQIQAQESARMEGLKTDLNLARSMITQLNADIAQQDSQLEDRNIRVAQLYAELADARADLEENSRAQAEQLQRLQAELAAGKAALQHREQQLADLMAWVERRGSNKGQPPLPQDAPAPVS